GWIFFARHGTTLEGVLPLYGTLWSYVNGMESGLLLALYALVVWMWVTGDLGSRSKTVVFGCALALLTLSRLDHVFLPLLILAFVTLRGWRTRRAQVLAMGLPFAILLGAYLLGNLAWFGSPVPVSGRLKSSFPHVQLSNVTHLWLTLRAPWNSNLNL